MYVIKQKNKDLYYNHGLKKEGRWSTLDKAEIFRSIKHTKGTTNWLDPVLNPNLISVSCNTEWWGKGLTINDIEIREVEIKLK